MMESKTPYGTIKVAGRLGGILLKVLDADGLTVPWLKVAIIREDRASDRELIAHEDRHLQQIKENGSFLFSIKYLLELALNGYEDNHFEKDARSYAQAFYYKYSGLDL